MKEETVEGRVEARERKRVLTVVFLNGYKLVLYVGTVLQTALHVSSVLQMVL